MTPPGLWTPKGIVAVVDTSVHSRAYLARADDPTPSLLIQEQAGYAYNSFTSPDILDETERILAREFDARLDRCCPGVPQVVRLPAFDRAANSTRTAEDGPGRPWKTPAPSGGNLKTAAPRGA